MKFSYGLEIEGMALEKDYDRIKEFLQEMEINYFITGDETIRVSDDLVDLTYTLDGEIQEVVPFEIHIGPFEWLEDDDVSKNTVQSYPTKIQAILYEMAARGLLTNNTCAFHVHLKPYYFELHSKQAHWASHLMLAYLIESDRYRRLLHYNNEKMYHHFWASVPAMMKEYKNLKKNIKKDSHCFLDSKDIFFKRGLFHCHPQGTLEWRGVRGMFDMNPKAYSGTTSRSFEKSVFDKWNFVSSVFTEVWLAFDPMFTKDSYKVHNKLLKMEKDVLEQNSH